MKKIILSVIISCIILGCVYSCSNKNKEMLPSTDSVEYRVLIITTDGDTTISNTVKLK